MWLEGDKRRHIKLVHDHGNLVNPLIVVYCGDFPGMTVVVIRGG
jgi:hypothetical protein